MSASDLAWLRREFPPTSRRPRTLRTRGLTRLDLLEHFSPLSPRLMKRIGRAFSSLDLNRYPDSEALDLKTEFAKRLAISTDHILLGKGSDELLQILFLSISGPILIAEPSFPMYRNIAEIVERKVHTVLLDGDLSLNMDRLLESVQLHAPALVVLSHPNNPTGAGLCPESVARLASAAPGGVLIDEAYHPFAGSTHLPLLEKFPNLMILRSLSKAGLAAIRIGQLIASPEIVRRLDEVRLPYNIDGMVQSAARLLCREALPSLEARARGVAARRDLLFDALGKIPGITPFPSLANFILFRTDSAPAIVVFSKLKERGILVREMSGDHPLLEGCLRVTVGQRAEVRRFLEALDPIMKGFL
ncbi:MAG: pyridoxal phosphate-dependent aminotransferase [Leptospirillia bacterium]